MAIRPLLLVSALALVSLPSASLAQQIQIQQMEVTGPDAPPFGMAAGRPLRTGTGRIRGRVLSETGTPVRRAQVRITGADVGGRTATTDADGRYEFLDLPDGRFTISATKAGYVTVQYGQTRPLEPGKPIELADKQTLDKADLVMPRGSVITGRIVDETGEPVADALVTAMRQRVVSGPPAPGQRRPHRPDQRPRPVPDVRPAAGRLLRQRHAPQPRWGDVRHPRAVAGDPGAHLRVCVRLCPVLLPGHLVQREAQKITVAPGQESQGIDFPLAQVRLARISGIVLNSEGKPVEGTMVSLTPGRGDVPLGMGTTSRTNREGAFTVTSVAPGDYTLQVRGMTMITSGGGGDTMMFTARIGRRGRRGVRLAAAQRHR